MAYNEKNWEFVFQLEFFMSSFGLKIDPPLTLYPFTPGVQ